uniref:Protein kinase domain-containing protein n=1 Tax=Leersia perrieri TaxID=77586 RepID=A0A0D9V3J2_9ORYZ
MPDVEAGSDADPPQARGCCCCACARSKIKKFLVRAAIVVVLFVMVCIGFAHQNLGAKLAVESVAYVATACLYFFTSSSWKEKTISGTFLVVDTVVVVCVEATTKTDHGLGLLLCTIVALGVYCIWKPYQALLSCIEHRLGRAPAATTASSLPLQPVKRKEEPWRPLVQEQPRAAFQIEGLPREYTDSEIQAMTEDFGFMVGRGGSATVFRGVLEDGTAVAVKRIVGDESVGEADFLSEITIVASVHHYALVGLLGYCLQPGGGRYLLYPFLENRSLDFWLFSGEERRRDLPWSARRHIAVDVAKALAYLHHECRNQILHLDIKPANILLDGEFRAHVSDFGISMSIGRDLTSVGTRGRGTLGYMAPEMLVNALSAKSDVYSYGMMLFELVGGRRNFEISSGGSSEPPDFSKEFLPCVLRDRMAEGRLMEAVDATMMQGAAGDVDEDQVEVVVKVAFWCTQHSRDMRLSMTEVVDMLEGRTPIPMPPIRLEFLGDTFLAGCARTELSSTSRVEQLRLATLLSAGRIAIMANVEEAGSVADPPRRRSCSSAYARSKIWKVIALAAILGLMFVVVSVGYASNRIAVKMIVESMAYVGTACLYIFNASSWKEKTVSGIFILVVTVVVVSVEAAARTDHGLAILVGTVLALLVYCIWKPSQAFLACIERCRLDHAKALPPTKQQDAGRMLVQAQQDAGSILVQAHHPRPAFRIEGLPREYTYGEIKNMTEDFQSMVGRGGSGAVFRGRLDDGAAVAVKRIVGDKSVGDAEFLTEVTIVASVHHYALVGLHGYCLQLNGDRYLVYPFFENGSLDTWLFAGEERRGRLPWATRRRIAVDVARALAYLHHECQQQILHLDIKPANILLDGDLRAHVSDFGISKAIGRDLNTVDTRGRGTVGYMPPEVLINALSAKSDVYSYGMTLFELVGGRRNFEPPNPDDDGCAATPNLTDDFLPRVMEKRIGEGGLMEVVDATLVRGAAGVDDEDVKLVVKVALCCTQRRRDMRPSMAEVVDMLEGRAAVELLPPESPPALHEFLGTNSLPANCEPTVNHFTTCKTVMSRICSVPDMSA